jgi:hypothetical protein
MTSTSTGFKGATPAVLASTVFLFTGRSMAFQFLCSIKIEKNFFNDSAANHKALVAAKFSNSAQMRL